MANWTTLKAAIAESIKNNGNQEITGQILQNALNSIISNVGANATFVGIATPETNPGAPDGPVFYLASQSGTYSNFGDIKINFGLNVILWNSQTWENYIVYSEKSANIVGFNTEGKLAGIKKIGEIYFNTETKLLRKAVNESLSSYITVPIDISAIYLYMGQPLIWNGDFFDNVFCSLKRNGLSDYYKNIFAVDNIGITNEGTPVNNEYYISTDYIIIDPELSVIQLTTYNSVGNIGGISFYDENHNFISSNKDDLSFNGFGIVTINTLRIPKNARYYRVSIHKTFKDWAFVSHEYNQYKSREYPQVYNGGITLNGDLDDSQKNSRYRTGLLYTKSKNIIFTSANYECRILTRDSYGRVKWLSDYSSNLHSSLGDYSSFIIRKIDGSSIVEEDVKNLIILTDSYANKEFYKYNDYTLEQGTIDGQGADDDSPSTLQTRVRSPYIKISDSILRITTDLYIKIVFYDENKNYIGRMAYYVQSAEISHNGYIRIVFSDANDSSISANAINEDISISYINDELYDKQLIIPTLEQGTIDGQGADDDSPSTLQTRVRTVNFIEGDSVEYIKVNNNSQEILLIYYDNNGNYITRWDKYKNETSNIILENRKIKIVVRNKDISEISTNDVRLMISTRKHRFTSDNAAKKEKRIYNVPKIGNPAIYFSEEYEHTSIDSLQINDLYNIYDALVDTYPDYIERNADIGFDSEGNPIRQYTVRYKGIGMYAGESDITGNLWDSNYYYDKILLTSGVHGTEKSASYGLALTIKSLFETENNSAKYILNNLTLIIVPCLNIWGFNTTTRNNYNDININRDAIDFTQSETKAFKNLIDSNSDAILYIDVHGASGRGAYTEIFKGDYFDMIAKAIAKLQTALKDNWEETVYSDILSYPNLRIVISSFTGTLASYGLSLGIPSFITETPRDNINGGDENFLSACKITKDMVINLIQMFGV